MVVSVPRPAAGSAPADWLAGRIGPRGDPDWVTRTVGPGFEAYARIFHPLDDGPCAPRWADIAAQNGRTMHASAQWQAIGSRVTDPAPDPMDQGRGFPGEPFIGNLHEEALNALCLLLARHMSTPQGCWFGVWDGWGWMHDGAHAVAHASLGDEPGPPIEHAPQSWRLDLTGPKFSLPALSYHLFTGPVHAASNIGEWVTANWFNHQSPSLFWPTDHAWTVATGVDFDTTLVGGSRKLIDDIVDSPRLEALHIDPAAPFEDTINIWNPPVF